MTFIITALIWIGVTALEALMRPRQRRPERPKPDSLGSYQLPTAEEGRPVPIVFGRVNLRGPNMIVLAESSVVLASGVYSYFMGGAYGICMGPIDALKVVYFNDKALPAPAIVIDNTNKGIVFNNGGADSTVNIPTGTYAGIQDVCDAAKAAMEAAIAGPWDIKYAFRVYSVGTTMTRNFFIKYQEVNTGAGTLTRFAILRPGVYTAAEMATEIARAMNEVENDGSGLFASYTCAYSSSKFTITVHYLDTFTAWKLLAFGGLTSAHVMLGYNIDADKSFTPGVPDSLVTSDLAVVPDKIVWGYAGLTGVLRFSQAGFTAKSVLGETGGVDKTIGTYQGNMLKLEQGIQIFEKTDLFQCTIQSDAFFGSQDGGVSGRLDVYKGTGSQVASDYLVSVLGTANLPGWRKLCYAVQRNMYIGNSAFPKPISFEVARYPNRLSLATHRFIGEDANPAEILFDVFQDSVWGLGLATGAFILTDFQSAGETLFSEALGLSFQIEDLSEAEEFVREVLRHIDGILYVSPANGLIGIALARGGYVVGDLPLIDNTNSLECTMERASWEQTRNVLKVRYPDRAGGYKERIVQFQNLASIQAMGPSVEEVALPGCKTSPVANLIGTRVLRAITYALPSFTIKVNRDLWQLHAGSVFRLTRSELNVGDLPCRVTNISPGTLEDSRITIDAVEDIWGMS